VSQSGSDIPEALWRAANPRPCEQTRGVLKPRRRWGLRVGGKVGLHGDVFDVVALDHSGLWQRGGVYKKNSR
jgi:hypothetical protein